MTLGRQRREFLLSERYKQDSSPLIVDGQNTNLHPHSFTMRLSSFLFLLSAACAISTLAHTLSNISAHRSNGRGISARSLSKHGSSAGVNPRKGTGSSYGTGTGIGTGSGSSCTFTSFPQYVAGKSKCASIVLQDLKVPAGQTLELAGLPKGATVTFAGKTTFGYKPWVGPLISASGSITITGAPGHVIDCEGRNWWDNRGECFSRLILRKRTKTDHGYLSAFTLGDVGSKKAKFLFAHQLNNAKIVGLNILNTPIQGELFIPNTIRIYAKVSAFVSLSNLDL